MSWEPLSPNEVKVRALMEEFDSSLDFFRTLQLACAQYSRDFKIIARDSLEPERKARYEQKSDRWHMIAYAVGKAANIAAEFEQ